MSKKLTIDEMQAIAEARGGRCLSVVYIDQDHHLEWECAAGHRWSAPAGQVKGTRNRLGTWCPTCAPRRSAKARLHTIGDMQRLAAARGGYFVSPEYRGSGQAHWWSCSEFPAHPKFAMRPNAVRQGQWCSRCAGNAKPSMADLDAVAKTKSPSARCLSTSYVNSNTDLEWLCGVAGHPSFRSSYRSVRHDNTWCPRCRVYSTIYTRDMLASLADSQGGELLSLDPPR